MQFDPLTVESLVEAASWTVGTALARRHLDVEIIRMHPGGGQYDVLQLSTPRGKLAQLNRRGTVHFHEQGQDAAVSWSQAFQDGPIALVERIERAGGLPAVTQLPMSTPRALVYRVLSALANLSLLRDPIEICMAYFDTSGYGGGPADWTGRFTDVQQRIEQRRATRPVAWPFDFWDPGYTFWQAKTKDLHLAFDAVTSDAWSLAGRRMNLAAAYDDVGRSMPRLLGAMLEMGADR